MVLKERVDEANARRQAIADSDRNKKIDARNDLVNKKLKLARKIEQLQPKVVELEQLKQAGKLNLWGRYQLLQLSGRLKSMQENSARLEQEIRSIRV